MVRTSALLALAAACACGSALAADAAPTQQTRMQGCNAQAKEKALKGDDRKAFMSDCLKKKA